MRQHILSSVCSLFMLLTLLWGGCVSCEQYFMLGSRAKDCCSPAGHCKKPASKGVASTACNQIAAEQQQTAVAHAILPIASPVLPVPVAVRQTIALYDARAVDPSPPDFVTLYSQFLV